MRRILIFLFVGLLWLCLLGGMVNLFGSGVCTKEGLMDALFGLGLLLPIILLLSHRSSKRAWEEVLIHLVALVGLLAILGVIYFQVPILGPMVERGDRALGPYVSTPPEVVTRMLEVAEVTNQDVVYDLGCGDGRIVIAAAQERGARGVGIEIEPHVFAQALEKVKEAGVADRVEIRLGDARLVPDLDKASVVALYVLPEAMVQMRSMLKNLKPGTRIVSHNFDLGDWEPSRIVQIYDQSGRKRLVYLWRIEAEKR